ncbi:hypothetical protein D3C72_2452230 [compost metagenome]
MPCHRQEALPANRCDILPNRAVIENRRRLRRAQFEVNGNRVPLCRANPEAVRRQREPRLVVCRNDFVEFVQAQGVAGLRGTF